MTLRRATFRARSGGRCAGRAASRPRERALRDLDARQAALAHGRRDARLRVARYTLGGEAACDAGLVDVRDVALPPRVFKRTARWRAG